MSERRSGPVQGEQLEIDFDVPIGPDAEAPVDISRHVAESSAYRDLVEARNAAYARHRSGARVIAGAALRALQAGDITSAEHQALFRPRGTDGAAAPTLPRPHVDNDYTEVRPLDARELAAGEGVRRPDDE